MRAIVFSDLFVDYGVSKVFRGRGHLVVPLLTNASQTWFFIDGHTTLLTMSCVVSYVCRYHYGLFCLFLQRVGSVGDRPSN